MTAQPKSASSARPFSRTPLTHQHVRDIVRQALEPVTFVHALWEGGSTAFGRDDAWSDVDLQACVDDDQVEETFSVIETALEKACGIEDRFILPEPTWHGHAQRFFRFRGQPPWLMLDLVVQKRSAENRFLEPEIHGEQPFLFDRIGLGKARPALDREAWEGRLRGRLEFLQARTRMFAHLVEKECRRRHAIDARHFYQSLVLNPLIELLRIRHDPARHDFGARYLHVVLPAPVLKRLEGLSFVRNLDDLQSKHRIALRWFDELARELARAPRLAYGLAGEESEHAPGKGRRS